MERIKKGGACILWTLTVLQLLFFCVYSLVYTLMYNQNLPNYSTHFLNADDWYRWIAILILEVGTVFFLFKSLTFKKKNANELISYVVLTTLMNVFFIYKLISDSIEIKKDYIDL